MPSTTNAASLIQFHQKTFFSKSPYSILQQTQFLYEIADESDSTNPIFDESSLPDAVTTAIYCRPPTQFFSKFHQNHPLNPLFPFFNLVFPKNHQKILDLQSLLVFLLLLSFLFCFLFCLVFFFVVMVLGFWPCHRKMVTTNLKINKMIEGILGIKIWGYSLCPLNGHFKGVALNDHSVVLKNRP